MTGLDVGRDVILEIAALITDDDLETVAVGPDLVIHQPPEALAVMDSTVTAMHTASGLLERVAASTVCLREAGDAVLSFLGAHLAEAGETPLCGNSIGMDRRFLARYLPEIDSFLHYRSIDVSTVKELAKRWQPAIYEDAPEKAKTHRALDDIMESVTELRWYRSTGFIGASAMAGSRCR